MKKLVSFFIFFISFFALLNNANSKIFLNSKELQGFEKIKNIKNKKEKPDKNGVIYVGQKGLILANGYGIMKFVDGGMFVGYFKKGNLRDGTWIINGTISTDRYEYDDKNKIKKNADGTPVVHKTTYRGAKPFEADYIKENIFLKNKISYEDYLKFTGKDKLVAKINKEIEDKNKKEFNKIKIDETELITYKDKKYKKLNFKEYGNFFGIKKDNNFYKGIYIGRKDDDGGQSDWYGFFTPKGGYHKGYFKHIYEDGSELYQYTEYKLDDTGEPFTIEGGYFAISDQYLINKESFELVKKYLMYEIDMPYSFYNFDTNKKETAVVEKVKTKKEVKTVEKLENIRLTTNENYYALVIGNNNYQHLEKLDAAENDAKVIADVLENKYGFEVNLLLNADYDTTVNSLFAITSKLKKNDNLLIYYAGHGELDKAENRGYWLPVDASYELRSKWVSNQRIVDRVKATKAKHVLLMIDSCFSGALMRGGNLIKKDISIDEKYILRLKNKKTRLVITSGGNEPVIDSDGGSHSLFAYKLIETLRQNKNVINSQYLFENIRKYVIANTDQTPELALVHKTGHDGGDFLFFPK